MKIKKIKILKSKVNVTFDNGEKLELDKEIYTNFYLYEGKEVSKKEYSEIKEYNNVAALLQYALRVRSKAIYSEYQIREKLYKKEATKSEVDKVIKSMKQYDLIDDDAFVKDYVEYYNSLNYGKNKILNKLSEKGIFEAKLSKIKFPITIERNKAKNVYLRLLKKYEKYNFTQKKQHVYSAYINLGFDSEVASEMVSLIKEEKNSKAELTKLEKDYEKVYLRLSRKYQKKELRQKVMQSLLGKGYRMNDVLNVFERKMK